QSRTTKRQISSPPPPQLSGFGLVFLVKPPSSRFPVPEQARLGVIGGSWPQCSRPAPPIQRHTSLAAIRPKVSQRVHRGTYLCLGTNRSSAAVVELMSVVLWTGRNQQHGCV